MQMGTDQHRRLPSGGSGRPSTWRSGPGWTPTPSPTRRPRPGRPTCPSTSNRNWPRPAALDAKATAQYALGVQAGANSDNYVRDTIYLATILFLIGISGHFRFVRIRVGLVSLGGVMLLVAVVAIATSPPIP